MRFDEDGGHCFLKCKFVRECWRELMLETVRISLLQFQSADAVVQAILKLDGSSTTKVVLLLSMWWEARNKVNAGDKKQTAYEVGRSVMSMAHLMNHPVANSKNSTNSLMGWSPPPDGILKINTDGAFVKETGVGAWGFIIRDSAGHAVIAGAGNAGLIYDALMAEALACVTALEAASMNGISRVQLEVDASELRSAIVSTTSDRSVCGMIFSDIRSLLYESFVCSKVSLIPQS
jgi:hypothetical protein